MTINSFFYSFFLFPLLKTWTSELLRHREDFCLRTTSKTISLSFNNFIFVHLNLCFILDCLFEYHIITAPSYYTAILNLLGESLLFSPPISESCALHGQWTVGALSSLHSLKPDAVPALWYWDLNPGLWTGRACLLFLHHMPKSRIPFFF